MPPMGRRRIHLDLSVRQQLSTRRDHPLITLGAIILSCYFFIQVLPSVLTVWHAHDSNGTCVGYVWNYGEDACPLLRWTRLLSVIGPNRSSTFYFTPFLNSSEAMKP
ncbi:hypothetical protein TELCIR_12959 [Teladorsagia circumcincta]|uniref:Uncharacterized protein n=1 Tax=Teladorsagia circumcincta TaxID=45464 RepID=A0A2G9U5F2_TELCI|nr:hypothetical protein TELCIR_12959 [Teladorsagia circumcincta]